MRTVPERLSTGTASCARQTDAWLTSTRPNAPAKSCARDIKALRQAPMRSSRQAGAGERVEPLGRVLRRQRLHETFHVCVLDRKQIAAAFALAELRQGQQDFGRIRILVKG